MPPLRVAIVGFGKIARDQHVPAIAATAGVELVAVASSNASLPGVPHAERLEKLWRAGPPIDGVALCPPPQVRHAQAAMALAAGKHVMLEKPPGATVAELSPLGTAARAAQRTLFATWHSRFAPAVEPARQLLSGRKVTSVKITWKEDVRVWHPGQAWIFEPGGLGVFDPGINALSILTRILPQSLFVTSADLAFPANRDAPIAATLALSDAQGVKITAEFDFLQTGPQSWDIDLDTDGGPVTLSMGGARLRAGGKQLVDAADADYAGRRDDIVLGHDPFEGYLARRQFFGATVGRYANRIAGARFTLDGTEVQLAANNGTNALHGGLEGFDRRNWRIVAIEDGDRPAVTLAYTSANGEEGYPGALEVEVTWRLAGPMELQLDMTARTDRPTVVNLTNHNFFNLAGARSGRNILDHHLTVAADHFLAIDAGAIPLPQPPGAVDGTPFDFRPGDR